MFRDVRRYIRLCIPCQKYKTEQRQQAGKMLKRQVSEPFVILCVDFVGPLPRTKEGNTTAKEDTGDQPGQSQRGQPTDTSNVGRS